MVDTATFALQVVLPAQQWEGGLGQDFSGPPQQL